MDFRCFLVGLLCLTSALNQCTSIHSKCLLVFPARSFWWSWGAPVLVGFLVVPVAFGWFPEATVSLLSPHGGCMRYLGIGISSVALGAAVRATGRRMFRCRLEVDAWRLRSRRLFPSTTWVFARARCDIATMAARFVFQTSGLMCGWRPRRVRPRIPAKTSPPHRLLLQPPPSSHHHLICTVFVTSGASCGTLVVN